MPNSIPKYFYCQKNGVTQTISKFFQWKFGCIPKNEFEPSKGIYILTWSAYKLKISSKNQIVYNTENLRWKFPSSYFQFLDKAIEVWDYSPLNNQYYESKYVPLEVYPDPIIEAKRIIKYLFYGSPCKRRLKVIKELGATFIDRQMSDPTLNYWIARSEYILSISFTDKQQFNDSARIIPALSKGAKVIAERCDEPEFNQKMESLGVKILTYKELCKLS